MKRLTLLSSLMGLVAIFNLPGAMAQYGPRIDCPNCQVENVNTQTLAESIADILELSLSEVTVVAGETPGTYTVTLADGRVFIVAPLGPAFRHQSVLQRQLAQSESGYLHLRTQTRLELQLRSAIFREAAVVGEMLRLGWRNFSWFDNGMEVESPQGVHYCFAPDLRATTQAMGGADGEPGCGWQPRRGLS